MSEEQDRVIRIREMCQIYGASRASILNWVEAGLVPKPVPAPGRGRAWLASDVKKHLESLKQAELQEAAS